MTHPSANLATLSKSCAHFAVECECGYNSASRVPQQQAGRQRRRRDLGTGQRAAKRTKSGRIQTESVEVLHVHAMRESKQEKIELGSTVSVDERQDGG